MLDLKAIQLKDFARVRDVEFLNKAAVESIFPPEYGVRLPVVMKITGDNFSSVTDVLINGVQVQYLAQTAVSLLAVLPEALLSQTIKSINVLNNKRNFTNYSLFSFELGATPTIMSGMNKLVAQYVKILLTTPGSDNFDTTLGAGLQKLPGTNMQAQYTFLTKVALALTQTAEDMRRRQFNLDLPPDEKMQSVEVLTIDFDKGDPSSIAVKIKVNSLAASNIPVDLTLGVQALEDATGVL